MNETKNKKASLAIFIFCLIWGLFQIWYATLGMGVLDQYQVLWIYLMFALSLAFLVYPTSPKKGIAWYDILLAIIATLPLLYLLLNHEYVISGRIQNVTPLKPIEKVLGVLLIVLVLEATRRATGWALPIVATFFIIYSLFGHYFPGSLYHERVPPEIFLEDQYLLTLGIFGIPIMVAATVIIYFSIFGALLQNIGLSDYFMEFAKAFVGHRRGGPAKVAVVSSGLMGMISGSAVANVYGTGVITIPMMKKLGFPNYLAGAVEAAASTGGQITPPLMGAAAFVMAQFLGVDYIDVAIAAVIPALLYYIGMYMQISFEAQLKNLRALSPEEIPSKSHVLKRIYLLTPIAIVTVLLLLRYPVHQAVLATMGYTIVLIMVTETLRVYKATKDKEVVFEFAKSLGGSIATGTRQNIPMALAAATAGIVVGVITETGLGVRFASMVLRASHGIPWVAAILTAIVTVILGMGIPTTPAYIITASLSAPALLKLGFPELSVHMFILYYAALSAITPPVAMAAYAGATVAEAPFMKTAITACRLGIVAFIMPFVFMYKPEILINYPAPILAKLGWIGLLTAIVLVGLYMAYKFFGKRQGVPIRWEL